MMSTPRSTSIAINARPSRTLWAVRTEFVRTLIPAFRRLRIDAAAQHDRQDADGNALVGHLVPALDRHHLYVSGLALFDVAIDAVAHAIIGEIGLHADRLVEASGDEVDLVGRDDEASRIVRSRPR